MFFKPRTVDAAIAPLLKAASDLETVAELCRDQIEGNKSTINRLGAENAVSLREQNRATSVLTALRGITNPTQE